MMDRIIKENLKMENIMELEFYIVIIIYNYKMDFGMMGYFNLIFFNNDNYF